MPAIPMDCLNLFAWVWHTSVRVSVLIALLLMVKFVLQNKISARLNYLLWSVVLVGLLLPWTPRTSWSLMNLAGMAYPKTMSFTHEGKITTQYSLPADDGPAGAGPGKGLADTGAPGNSQLLKAPDEPRNSIAAFPVIHRILFALWLMGFAAFALTTLLINRRFSRRVKGRSVLEPKLLSAFSEAKNRLKIQVEVPLIQTQAVKSPALFGLFPPGLLLPADLLADFTPEQLKHVFGHELLHLKRKDIYINWLAQGLCIVHWFNPILWYAYSKMREDQEIACDAATLEHSGSKDPLEYAYTLIKLAENNIQAPRIPGLSSLLGANSQIKKRISRLKVFSKASLKWSLLGVALVGVLAFAILTDAKAGFFNKEGNAAGNPAGKEISQTEQLSGENPASRAERLSAAPEGSFDYQTYLSFTPLLPSYSAGFPLTYAQIACSQNIPSIGFPTGQNSKVYSATYGSHGAFSISEAEPNQIHSSASEQGTATQIQIGDLPATLTVEQSVGFAQIQFIKNGVEYFARSIPGGGISIAELKKVCASIAVPAAGPPTDIYIDKMGPEASKGLSFKALQAGDILVPPGYQFDHELSQIYIQGEGKSEKLSLYYKGKTASVFLDIQMSVGDHPDGPGPAFTPNSASDSDYETKQIAGTEVKLRKTGNKNLPAALFTGSNGLLFTISGPDLPEGEAEKVAAAVLQAAAKP